MARTTGAVNPPEAPRVGSELEELQLRPEALGSGVSVDGARIARAELAGVRASDLSLIETRLEDVDLSGARLDRLRLADVAVDRGNLATFAARPSSARSSTAA